MCPLINTPYPERVIISQQKTSFLGVVFDGDHDFEGPRAPNAHLDTVNRNLSHHLRRPFILASTLNGAKFFCDKFVEMCGSDLTVDNPGNPFWHTGTAAPINIPGSERERRPQKAIWRVAAGLSGGKGAEGRGLRKPQAWGQFVHGRIVEGISGMYSGVKFDRNTG